MVEVCVLTHVRAVTSVPHDAQESLSSDHIPTLSYSLPFYHSVIEDWEHLKEVYPLLSPFIQIDIKKVEEYINKSKLSCIRSFLFLTCSTSTPHYISLKQYPHNHYKAIPIRNPRSSFHHFHHHIPSPTTITTITKYHHSL